MRIIGLGVDLADISRIERVLARYPRFARRCFTTHEREYAERFARDLPAATQPGSQARRR